MNKIILILITLIPFTNYAQNFLPPMERFSGKKEDILILNSGEKIVFFLDDLDRKKGLIINVAGKTLDGKKFDYDADEIKELYLVPSDMAKIGGAMKATRSILKASRTDLSELSREHIQFFQQKVEGRKETVLLQLLNPDFQSRMRIFDDPWAAETMGIGFGGMQLTGGIAKSYYANYDGKTIKIFKRNYEDLFAALFANCKGVLTKYDKAAWRDLPLHLDTFETECAEKQ
jgi:hypothetical protein